MGNRKMAVRMMVARAKKAGYLDRWNNLSADQKAKVVKYLKSRRSV